jgi:hypothetical protein
VHREVVVGAVGDALELTPLAADEVELVLDVDGALGVVRELLGRVLVLPQPLGVDAEVDVPGEALVDPRLVPLLVLAGLTKNSISICSNSRVRKMKLPGVISLRKLLPIWPMPNGGFLRADCCTLR